MANTVDVVAYEVTKDRYYMGMPMGITKGKYHLVAACIIKKENLPKGKSLEEGLKEIYLKSEKENKQVSTSEIMNPQPLKFAFNVEDFL
ncbi:MAG: hypothetical protein M1416_03285 [Candidatus Pacearchaeota archaeon]|nr:hypothetical protein [Candidatus Pacearchaeota archaeon]